MQIQEVFDFVKDEYGTEPEYPWMDCNSVLRHKDNNKWYAAVLNVSKDKLGLEGTERIDVLDLKCDPFLIDSLVEQPGFHRAYHMNKRKWITIRLDETVDIEKIKELIRLSFNLTSK